MSENTQYVSSFDCINKTTHIATIAHIWHSFSFEIFQMLIPKCLTNFSTRQPAIIANTPK